jgi:hypothetical protein
MKKEKEEKKKSINNGKKGIGSMKNKKKILIDHIQAVKVRCSVFSKSF